MSGDLKVSGSAVIVEQAAIAPSIAQFAAVIDGLFPPILFLSRQVGDQEAGLLVVDRVAMVSFSMTLRSLSISLLVDV